MEAVFTIRPSEFDETIHRIKEFLLRGNTNSTQITISVRDDAATTLFFKELDEALTEEAADKDCVTFSMEEFRDFYKSKLAAA